MKSENVKLTDIKLAGITTRTANNLEMEPKTANIGPTKNKYFENNLARKLTSQTQPGITYCVYTHYQTDVNGMYTFFIGEEVESFDGLDSIFTRLTIPEQSYVKFNVGPGKMPFVCIEAWKNIWQMTSEALGGERAYIADFEIYDNHKEAKDPENTSLAIYIGIQKSNR